MWLSMRQCQRNFPLHRRASLYLAAALLAALALPLAAAQSYRVLHNFSGQDGANPQSGVTMDRAGNLYGTTSQVGWGWGTVYALKAPSYTIFQRLYRFNGQDDAWPYGGLAFGPDGALYGTTSQEQTTGSTYGTIFRLQPPTSFCQAVSCPWRLTRIHVFTFPNDGYQPYWGQLAFDRSGNIFGTTKMGGVFGFGEVFELSPAGGGSYTKSTLYAFGRDSGDGNYPVHGVVLDGAGNLFGTTYSGGTQGGGTLFELSPSGSGWTETILHNFSVLDQAGQNLRAGVILDSAGNLYGSSSSWGGDGGGVVFQWKPSFGLSVINLLEGAVLDGPVANLLMDSSGNLYGATSNEGANNLGSIFKLTKQSDGTWSYTDLHDFSGTDGAHPWGDLLLDGNGHLFGTTTQGGAGDCNCGVVWEITLN